MSLRLCEKPCGCEMSFTQGRKESRKTQSESFDMKQLFAVAHRARVLRPAMLAVLLAPLISHAQRPAVETVQFQSKLIDATLPYNVVLPPDYRRSRTTRYPVLYLLHGLTGHYSDWLTK